MDKRDYNQDMINKMYDIIELMYILNRLTNEFYEEDYSKQYLLDMMDNMQNMKYSFDKYRRREISKGPDRSYPFIAKNKGFLDKIILYLKSLNGDY